MATQSHILNIKEVPSNKADSSSKVQVKYTYQKNKQQKPRRNKSAFILFSNDTRSKIKEEEGNLNSNEMMIKLAERWKNLSKEEREKYETKAKNDKLRYQQELVDFAKFHPDEIIHNKTKNNHVKKPCSAYGMFLKERKDLIREQNPKLKMADILKLVSQEWKKLSDEERQAYKDQASTEKEVVRTKLCEAIGRDQAAKQNCPVTQPSKSKKKVKKSPEATEDSVETLNVKTEETIVLQNAPVQIQSDIWPRFDEISLPSNISNEFPNTQIKAEIPLETEKKASSIQLFPTSSLDIVLNSTLWNKKQESNSSSNDPGLLSLLGRQIQRPNEVLADILSFDINFDKITSINFFDQKSLFKLKSESRNSISQFLNLSQGKPGGTSRAKFLNDTIINALDQTGSKDSITEDPASTIEKKNI